MGTESLTKYSVTIRSKVTASIMLAIFLCTSAINPGMARAQAPLTLSAEVVTVPQTIGTINAAVKSAHTKAPLIVHVQDAHLQYEAQKNISSILESLQKSYGIDTIYIEGTQGTLNTSLLRAFPFVEQKKAFVDRLLKKGEISGAEAYSVLSEKNVLLYGVDHKENYVKNIRAYVEASRVLDQSRIALDGLKSTLGDIQRTRVTPELAQFLEKKESFQNKQTDALEYTRVLIALCERVGIDTERYTHFQNLCDLEVYQRKIKSDAIVSETRALIDSALVNVLSPEDMDRLAVAEMDYQGKRIEAYAFYRFLREVALKADIDFRSYENINRYYHYLTLVNDIDAHALMIERERIEENLIDTLASTQTDREFVRIMRNFNILYNMFTLHAIPEELQYFRQHQKEFSNQAFNKVLQAHEKEALDTALFSIDKCLPYFIEFYRLAESREDSFVKQTMKHMKKKACRNAVLLTGGYHTAGLEERFEKNEVSYVVVAPRLSELPKENLYDKVMRSYDKYFGVTEGQRGGTVKELTHFNDQIDAETYTQFVQHVINEINVVIDNVVSQNLSYDSIASMLDESGKGILEKLLTLYSEKESDAVDADDADRLLKEKIIVALYNARIEGSEAYVDSENKIQVMSDEESRQLLQKKIDEGKSVGAAQKGFTTPGSMSIQAGDRMIVERAQALQKEVDERRAVALKRGTIPPTAYKGTTQKKAVRALRTALIVDYTKRDNVWTAVDQLINNKNISPQVIVGPSAKGASAAWHLWRALQSTTYGRLNADIPRPDVKADFIVINGHVIRVVSSVADIKAEDWAAMNLDLMINASTVQVAKEAISAKEAVSQLGLNDQVAEDKMSHGIAEALGSFLAVFEQNGKKAVDTANITVSLPLQPQSQTVDTSKQASGIANNVDLKNNLSAQIEAVYQKQSDNDALIGNIGVNTVQTPVLGGERIELQISGSRGTFTTAEELNTFIANNMWYFNETMGFASIDELRGEGPGDFNTTRDAKSSRKLLLDPSKTRVSANGRIATLVFGIDSAAYEIARLYEAADALAAEETGLSESKATEQSLYVQDVKDAVERGTIAPTALSIGAAVEFDEPMLQLGVNGYGRIGKLSLRQYVDDPNIRVRAIAGPASATKLKEVLLRDSSQGNKEYDIEAVDFDKADELGRIGYIKVNGSEPIYIVERQADPEKLAWAKWGVVFVDDTTGTNKDPIEVKGGKGFILGHLNTSVGGTNADGALYVWNSAPFSPADKKNKPLLNTVGWVVDGVSNDQVTANAHVVCNASCTTNCLATGIMPLINKFGFDKSVGGLALTIHTATSSQKNTDQPAGGLEKVTKVTAAKGSIIPTTTGAGTALQFVVPGIGTSIPATAYRVEGTTSSVVEVIIPVMEEVTPEMVKEVYRQAAKDNPGTVIYAEAEDALTSVNVTGLHGGSVFDASGLHVFANKKLVKLRLWYDNEDMYTAQMTRAMKDHARKVMVEKLGAAVELREELELSYVAHVRDTEEQLGQALKNQREQVLSLQTIEWAEEGKAPVQVQIQAGPQTNMALLKSLGAQGALVGHSEVRKLYEERGIAGEELDNVIAQQLAEAFTHFEVNTFAFGELRAMRDDAFNLTEEGKQDIQRQIEIGLSRISDEQLLRTVPAYEPRWAIGTGKTPTAEQAQEVHAMVRAYLEKRLGARAQEISIQYGGSMKPENAAGFFAMADIDGGLIGGVALKKASTLALIRTIVNEVREQKDKGTFNGRVPYVGFNLKAELGGKNAEEGYFKEMIANLTTYFQNEMPDVDFGNEIRLFFAVAETDVELFANAQKGSNVWNAIDLSTYGTFNQSQGKSIAVIYERVSDVKPGAYTSQNTPEALKRAGITHVIVPEGVSDDDARVKRIKEAGLIVIKGPALEEGLFGLEVTTVDDLKKIVRNNDGMIIVHPALARTVYGLNDNKKEYDALVAEQRLSAGRAIQEQRKAVAVEQKAILNTIGVEAEKDPVKRLAQAKATLAQVEKEIAQPGTGVLPKIGIISDYHGDVARFLELLSDFFRQTLVFPDKARQEEFELGMDMPIIDQMKEYGIDTDTANFVLYLNGDLLDRGPYGIKCFELAKQLITDFPGRVRYVSGNHNIVAFGNLMGLHLPTYEGYNLYGDTEAETLLKEMRMKMPQEVRDVKWWTKKLAEYNARMAKFEAGFVFTEGLYEGQTAVQVRKQLLDVFFKENKVQLSARELDVWESFLGHFDRKSVPNPALGLMGIGKTSVEWWKDIRAQLESTMEERTASRTMTPEMLGVWQQAIAMALQIETGVDKVRKETMASGEWTHRIFEGINRQAYRSAEWWCKDWSSHKGWGDTVIKEVNKRLYDQKKHTFDVSELKDSTKSILDDVNYSVLLKVLGKDPLITVVTQENYISNLILQDLALFDRQNFNTYILDPLKGMLTHGMLPPDEDSLVRISYKGKNYVGKDVLVGLDRIAADIRNVETPIHEVREGMAVVISWYADLTTRMKPNDINEHIKKHGVHKLADNFEVRFLYQGHNILSKLMLPFMVEDNGRALFSIDKGMAQKFGGEGGYVLYDADGVRLRGFAGEHERLKHIITSPETRITDKKGNKTIIENLPMDKMAFLTSLREGLQEEIAILEAMLAVPEPARVEPQKLVVPGVGELFTMDDVDFKGKRVVQRVDFNCPADVKMEDGKVVSVDITDPSRIIAGLPSIREALSRGAKYITLVMHFEPKVKVPGEDKPKGMGVSTQVIAEKLKELLPEYAEKIAFVPGSVTKEGLAIEPAQLEEMNHEQGIKIFVLDQIRFAANEKSKEAEKRVLLSDQLGALGDVYVNDAMGAIHREHASMVVPNTPKRAVGRLIQYEVGNLAKVFNPERPLVAIFGGAKVEDKVQSVMNTIDVMQAGDKIMIGGAMAYTFMKADDPSLQLGKSLVQQDKIELAKSVLAAARAKNITIYLPIDHVITTALGQKDIVHKTSVGTKYVPANFMGVDIGRMTQNWYMNELDGAGTIVWNGPMGAFEKKNGGYSEGSRALAVKIAEHAKNGVSVIIGGGDTGLCVKESGVDTTNMFISTAGGAFLEFMNAKGDLPVLRHFLKPIDGQMRNPRIEKEIQTIASSLPFHEIQEIVKAMVLKDQSSEALWKSVKANVSEIVNMMVKNQNVQSEVISELLSGLQTGVDFQKLYGKRADAPKVALAMSYADIVQMERDQKKVQEFKDVFSITVYEKVLVYADSPQEITEQGIKSIQNHVQHVLGIDPTTIEVLRTGNVVNVSDFSFLTKAINSYDSVNVFIAETNEVVTENAFKKAVNQVSGLMISNHVRVIRGTIIDALTVGNALATVRKVFVEDGNVKDISKIELTEEAEEKLGFIFANAVEVARMMSSGAFIAKEIRSVIQSKIDAVLRQSIIQTFA